MIIDDGKGNGTKAEVRKSILQVSTADEALVAARNGDAYVLASESITLSADDYLIVLLINQDGQQRDMIVTKVDMAGASTDNNAVLEINLGGTFTTTVANSTAAIPGNVNGGSGKVAGGEFYVNDGSGDMTTESGAYIGYTKKQALQNYNTELSIPGGWVIPYGQSLSVSCTKDGKYYGGVHFYYRD